MYLILKRECKEVDIMLRQRHALEKLACKPATVDM